MATITEIRLVDDLDQSEADESVEFSIDGTAYEIDLSATNAKRLREALAEFVGAARPARTAAPARRRRSSGAPASKSETQEARAWLISKGHKVSDRGRISADLMDVWRASGQGRSEQNRTATASETNEEPMAAGETTAEDESGPRGGEEVVLASPDDLDTSDDAIIAWHQVKGYKVDDKKVANGLMRHRYLKAHGAA